MRRTNNAREDSMTMVFAAIEGTACNAKVMSCRVEEGSQHSRETFKISWLVRTSSVVFGVRGVSGCSWWFSFKRWMGDFVFVFPLREEEEGCFLESSSSILLPSPFFSARRFCSCIAIAAAACPVEARVISVR